MPNNSSDIPWQHNEFAGYFAALPIEPTLTKSLSQAFELQPIELGASLTLNFLYLVCEGRVRLLCHSRSLNREVSAIVLEPGAVFGADEVFCETTIAYRAIAAGAGKVARITIAELKLWLSQCPELQQVWGEQIQQQQDKLALKSSAVRPTPKNLQTAPATSPVETESEEPQNEEIVQPPPRAWRLRQPFIAQQSATDCGIACLAMIGQYWGKRWTINGLRTRISFEKSGLSLKSLAIASESLGFQSRPIRASLGKLRDQNRPWIAHWQGDHYLVVYRIKRNAVIVSDPATGRRSIPIEEFQQLWTGYALLLEPTQNLASISTKKASLNHFWSLLAPYQGIVVQIVSVSLLLQIFGLITPIFTQVILDKIIIQKSWISLNIFTFGLFLFSVWGIGLTAIRQYLLDYLSNRVDLTLISQFINHTLLLPLKFFESRHVGDIVTRIQENQKVQLFLTRQAIIILLDALMVFVYLGLMAYYNLRLMLLVLFMIPFLIALVLISTPFLRRISRDLFQQDAIATSSVVELLSGIQTIKSAAVEQTMRWRWEGYLTDMVNTRFRGQKLANRLQIGTGLINIVGSIALLWMGATFVIRGELSIGQFVAFNMLVGSVLSPVLALAQLWDELQEVTVSVERLNDIFGTPLEENTQAPLLVLPPLQGEVRFENVSFSYHDGDREVIQNLSFEAHPGQTIAIVGASGSGKTTIANLLQGLYHPTKGRVLVDGHDLRYVSLRSLRSQMGVVPQECFLFSGTILENITLFQSEISLEAAIAAAKLADAHRFIQDFPLGYQTKVGERGMMLSGGQRQRIAIARAFLNQPRILILDEATASLDIATEHRLQKNISELAQDCTTFLITHRRSTAEQADWILVLDQGILVEQGNYQQLMDKRGVYYHLTS